MPSMNPEVDPNQPETVEIDLDQLNRAREEMAKAMLKTAHNWRQSGTLISCTSCPFGHGFAVVPGIHLTGVDDDGKPILTKVF